LEIVLIRTPIDGGGTRIPTVRLCHSGHAS
jgi:hypothetical protein